MRAVFIFTLAAMAAASAMADVSATAILSPPSVPIFRTAQYVVEIEGPKGLHLPALDIAGDLKGIEVSPSSPTSEEIGGERERVRVVYTLDASEPGQYTLPGRSLDLGNGQKAELPALTLTVREATEAEEKQAATFVDIGDPAEVAPPRSSTATLVGLATLLLACIAAGIWYWQKNREVVVWTAPALKPWQVAQNRLEELASRRLPQQGRFDAFYVDLSAILRYYIEDRFHLRAPERTTQEFLAEAARANVVSEAQQAMLAQFLRHCDRVKFARYEPAFAEMERSFEEVRQFVIETTPLPSAQAEAKEAA